MAESRRIWATFDGACGLEGVAIVRASSEADLELGEREVALPIVREGRRLGFLVVERRPDTPHLSDEALALVRGVSALAAAWLGGALDPGELQRAEALRTHFVALASHELRAPAAVIHGISSTLHLRGEELAHEQAAELTSALYEQTERMRRLVDQLLDLSRLEAGAIEIEPESVAVRRRVEEIVATVAGDRAADVEIDIPAELETIVDPNAFDRIVSNLLANALRHGAPPVTIEARQADTHFRLAVEDCGAGVPAEFVARLFQRFTRSEGARRGAGGAGLGLAIAQSYAEAHGGELFYERAEPDGARFYLVLPRPVSSKAV